jgi:signal peptidase I
MNKNDRGLLSARASAKKNDEGLWETAKVILQALAIAFVVRTFLFQPFNIPTSSMYPTLKIGDYLFVSKLSYGYSKYSFNFGFSAFSDKPIVSCCSFVDFAGRKILADTPKRGQVAVFKYPGDLNVDYIKRVIGLPGDHIQMKQGVLFINGVEVKKVKVEDYIDPDGESGVGPVVPQFEETLPNGVTYRVLDFGETDADTTEEYVVPADHYFMMGDNRDNSQDSRFLNKVGYVPIENFVGRADVIFFSFQKSATLYEPWKWPFQIRWSRFFNWIQAST